MDKQKIKSVPRLTTESSNSSKATWTAGRCKVSKAVLLSIRPEWCKKILSGEKTVEIRKTRPKLETPYNVWIYCTLAGSDSLFMDVLNRDVAAWNRGGWPEKKGRVIGEFTCDQIDKLAHVGVMGSIEPPKLQIVTPDLWYKPVDELLQAACLTEAQAEKYLKGGDGYGWHISDLRIYDRPRKLQELTGLRNTRFGIEPVEITRPPQSWCYMEDGE